MTVGKLLASAVCLGLLALLVAMWAAGMAYVALSRPLPTPVPPPTPVYAGEWGKALRRDLTDIEKRLYTVELEVLLRADGAKR